MEHAHKYEEVKQDRFGSEQVSTFVCRECKQTKVVREREYPAVVFSFRFKADVVTTYVISPEIFELGSLENIDGGNRNYEFTVSLRDSRVVFQVFTNDDRIEEWHTAEKAVSA